MAQTDDRTENGYTQRETLRVEKPFDKTVWEVCGNPADIDAFSEHFQTRYTTEANKARRQKIAKHIEQMRQTGNEGNRARWAAIKDLPLPLPLIQHTKEGLTADPVEVVKLLKQKWLPILTEVERKPTWSYSPKRRRCVNLSH